MNGFTLVGSASRNELTVTDGVVEGCAGDEELSPLVRKSGDTSGSEESSMVVAKRKFVRCGMMLFKVNVVL